MSPYIYTSDADELTIHPATRRHDTCFMNIAAGEDECGIYIPNANAPTVALELLKAAGRESVIVPKVDLPTVTQSYGGDANSFRVGGESVVFTSAANAREWVLRDIAVWQHLEAREAAEKAEAETAGKKLQERRDALALKLGYGWGCERMSSGIPFRSAIDYALELEDKLEASK